MTVIIQLAIPCIKVPNAETNSCLYFIVFSPTHAAQKWAEPSYGGDLYVSVLKASFICI